MVQLLTLEQVVPRLSQLMQEVVTLLLTVQLIMAGAVTFTPTLEVDGESTLASAVIEDLTDNRVVIAGTGGIVEDSANLTFDGTTLTTTDLTVDNIGIDGNSIVADSGALIFEGVASNETLMNEAGNDVNFRVEGSGGKRPICRRFLQETLV